jgi:hypothetical protein
MDGDDRRGASDERKGKCDKNENFFHRRTPSLAMPVWRGLGDGDVTGITELSFRTVALPPAGPRNADVTADVLEEVTYRFLARR